MAPNPGPARAPVLAAGFLLLAGAFAAGYCQAPLYYQNQNQYFLHGLADAGGGLLRDDWLANTRDPTPVFSALVALTARYLHPWAFYLYYALLLGAYASALLGLFASLAGEDSARRWPAFLALLLASHSAAARWASYRWLGQDYPWYLQSGVAGQYLLGPVLQPSAFGVLLVVALCLFVRGRALPAVAFAALAATVHPTYLLLAGLLTLGFMVALVTEGHARKALGLGALGLALVLPTLLHALSAFRPTSPGQFARAQDILVNFRIPHHARVDLWLDPVAGLQIAWAALGIALAWRTRLFPVLAVVFVGGLVLTLLQVATGNKTLALLFPWRVSALLVPVATAVVLARVVALRGLPLGGPAARVASGVVLAGLVTGGAWISVNRLAFYTPDEELAVMEFVARHKERGDVYFIPVRVPELASTVRGSFKSDFKPLPEKQSDVRLIPMDFERFRLLTGAPVFVDFKSIPYKDTDVLEWRRRIDVLRSVQDRLRAGRLDAAFAELRRWGISHLVLPANQPLRSPALEKVYGDDYYRVYRLKRSPTSGRVLSMTSQHSAATR
jgi:hypothetical protein